MYRDPNLFPQHAKLAAAHDEAQVAIAFARWLNESGYQICTREPDGSFAGPRVDLDHVILKWLGVDWEALEREQRDIAEQQAQEAEALVRAAAAGPLVVHRDT